MVDSHVRDLTNPKTSIDRIYENNFDIRHTFGAYQTVTDYSVHKQTKYDDEYRTVNF